MITDEEQLHRKKEIVESFLNNNVLISPDLLTEIGVDGEFKDILDNTKDKNITIVGKEIKSVLSASDPDFDWTEFDKSKALYEKEKHKDTYHRFMGYLKDKLSEQEAETGDKGDVKITFSYKEESGKRTVQDFVSMFNKRYKFLERLLSGREDLSGATSIVRILNKKLRETVTLIGIVKDLKITKNNNLVITLEDPTGEIRVLVNKNKADLYKEARDIVRDEVIGVVGGCGDRIVFANKIIWPEVPYNPEIKKGPEEEYAVFIGDTHFGSKHFLKDRFENFIKWINSNYGNKTQKTMAEKVKYLFVLGDLVDGVGIYPNQENDLVVPDIYEQYNGIAEYLKQVPERINMIICPGNHDAMRISEPQPPLDKDFAKAIWELPNTILLSNPGYVNIGAKEGFSGFDILLYHGFSFPYYADAIESIRSKGGLERVDLIMGALMKKRHLAPTQTSSLYIPEPNYDPLIITKVPDLFVTGHIHRASASNYKNITLINASSWITTTDYQEKMGLVPQPARAVVVNLKTRAVKIMRF